MWNSHRARLGRVLVLSLALGLTVSCTNDEASIGEPVADEGPVVADACALLSADEVRRITSWEVSDGTDHSDPGRSGTRSVCSFSETNHAGAVQVQWAPDAGAGEFERARSAMEAAGMDGRDVDVPGADEAYDSPAHGVVGMQVGDAFVQVSTIGPAVSDSHHLELAAAVARNLR
jgi:hypothetical protein